MRKLLMSVILFFLWNCLHAQKYIATWTGSYGTTVHVQRSSDMKNWKDIFVTKDSTIEGTNATYYWRVFLNPGYSDTVWVYAVATITNVKFKPSTKTILVTWAGHTETNLAYYSIESISNSTVVMKHGGNYIITIPRTGDDYEIIGHYKNGSTQLLKVFNQ